MGFIRKLLGKPPLGTILRRARARMAAGDFDRAHRLVAQGLEDYVDAEPLRELELTLRRAQARAGMQSLRELISQDDDARAYEQLVALYLELGMAGEAKREALAYASAHPDGDMPHLLIGEMSLQTFLDQLQARDAHVAHQRLHRAATLNPNAVRPRLLLAEIYYCVGADASLLRIAEELAEIAPNDPLLAPLHECVEGIEAPLATETIQGLFEQVEVDGTLVREPATWPISQRRKRGFKLDEERAQRAAEAVVARGAASEVVLLQRGGTLLGHATQALAGDEPTGDEAKADRDGLVDVARTVARTVSRYAHDLDLGQFRRCTLQGDFGLVAVGELGGVVTGARWRTNPEPDRLWERVTVGLEGSLGGNFR